MAERIVIALKRRDRVEDILPYIEKIARPGMRVVFLLPYPVDLWTYLSSRGDTPTRAMRAGRKMNYRCSWEAQRALAEQKIVPARETLAALAVEAAVHVYTGNLRKVMATFALAEDTYLLMTSYGDGSWRRLADKIPLIGLVKRPRPALMLLRG